MMTATVLSEDNIKKTAAYFDFYYKQLDWIAAFLNIKITTIYERQVQINVAMKTKSNHGCHGALWW